jgi:putative hydrolase of the HAD superfamily
MKHFDNPAVSTTDIVFDLGGVLIEWRPRYIVKSFTTSTDLQTKILEDIFFSVDWLEFDAGKMTMEYAVRHFADKIGCTTSETRRLLEAYRDSLAPFPYTEPLLEKLTRRGYRLFVLSNINGDIMTHLQDRFTFWHRFNGIVASGVVGISKPNPAVFEYLLSTYGLSPPTTLLVDDTAENIDGAKSIGMQGILFTSVEDLENILLR